VRHQKEFSVKKCVINSIAALGVVMVLVDHVAVRWAVVLALPAAALALLLMAVVAVAYFQSVRLVQAAVLPQLVVSTRDPMAEARADGQPQLAVRAQAPDDKPVRLADLAEAQVDALSP
jgi:hypothetical protein